LSFGLLVPAPVGSAIGDDVTEALGVLHYEPPVRGVGRQNGLPSGEATSGPDVYTVKYDIESGRRWAKDVMVDGEDVWVTEKLHGMNSRYVYHDGKMHCGSRTEWKKEYVDNSHLTVEALVESSKGKLSAERAAAILEAKKGKPAARTVVWEALTPTLRSFCESNPGLVVYGEVYGAVQDLSYGHTAGQVSFAAFDVLDAGNWWDSQKFFDTLASYNAPTVPVLYHGPYDFDRVCDLAEGNSTLASHIREGVVLVPAVERSHRRLGRVKLKFVSAAYLERAK
jgi:RNA ligase (TIGR02306 family)